MSLRKLVQRLRDHIAYKPLLPALVLDESTRTYVTTGVISDERTRRLPIGIITNDQMRYAPVLNENTKTYHVNLIDRVTRLERRVAELEAKNTPDWEMEK